jgi:translocation and assembly module TamA
MFFRYYFSLFFLFLIIPLYLLSLDYEVQFVSPLESSLLKEIRNSSRLITLQKKPPETINGLRYRIASDLVTIKNVLDAFGYFDAKIKEDLQELVEGKVLVTIYIQTGVRYLLNSYKILQTPCEEENDQSFIVKLKEIGLKLQEPITSRKLVKAKEDLLFTLADKGYPLALIKKEQIFADYEHKTIEVELCIDTGPLCNFGPTTIKGVRDIKPDFIIQKIRWKEGEKYNSLKVGKTQQELLKTDLFSSVLITNPSDLSPEETLPMKINVTEAKHRNISVGASYATIDGFGVSFAWAHRNIRNMGEYLGFEADISQRAHIGLITYKKPDFLRYDQDFVEQAEAAREMIHVYHSNTYGLLSRIDRILNPYTLVSTGVLVQYIRVTHSIQNGHYPLLGLPFYLKYSKVDNLLNPRKGHTAIYRATPYLNARSNTSAFLRQYLTYHYYYPTSFNLVSLPFRLQLGSVAFSDQRKIPLTKLFFGGADDTLRGYKYKTVSPLNSHGQPVGGRGAIYFTFEPRLRLTETIGVVPFVDLGNITKKPYPNPCGKWHKSVGFGIRYFTFFGPLRIDIGFPLDRRHFDPRWRLYASIGQSF